MPAYETLLRVPHSADNLFQLISEIESYPNFIKWIETLRVSGKTVDGDLTTCLSEATIQFRGFRERFVTQVQSDVANRRIDTQLVRGPFRRLSNSWDLTPLQDGATELVFKIDYEFDNFVLRMLARRNFDLAVDRIMTSFTTEADRRYARSV